MSKPLPYGKVIPSKAGLPQLNQAQALAATGLFWLTKPGKYLYTGSMTIEEKLFAVTDEITQSGRFTYRDLVRAMLPVIESHYGRLGKVQEPEPKAKGTKGK